MLKNEIIDKLQATTVEVVQYVKEKPQDLLDYRMNKKWSIHENLDHLIKCIQPLSGAMNKPKLILRILFGKPNRRGRSYDELVHKYQQKIEAGGKASGNFVPKSEVTFQAGKLIKDYLSETKKLIKAISKWEESQLDFYLLPHPLLGKVTVREMLFFTIYHTEHHFELIKSVEVTEYDAIVKLF